MVIATPERFGTPLYVPGRTHYAILGNGIVVRAVEEVGPVVDVGRDRFYPFHKISPDIECWVAETGYKLFVSVLLNHSDSSWGEDSIYFFTRNIVSGFQDDQQVDQIVHIGQFSAFEDINDHFPIDTFQLYEFPCCLDLRCICVQSLDQGRSGLAKVHKQLRIITANADDQAAFGAEGGEEITVRNVCLYRSHGGQGRQVNKSGGDWS